MLKRHVIVHVYEGKNQKWVADLQISDLEAGDQEAKAHFCGLAKLFLGVRLPSVTITPVPVA